MPPRGIQLSRPTRGWRMVGPVAFARAAAAAAVVVGATGVALALLLRQSPGLGVSILSGGLLALGALSTGVRVRNAPRASTLTNGDVLSRRPRRPSIAFRAGLYAACVLYAILLAREVLIASSSGSRSWPLIAVSVLVAASLAGMISVTPDRILFGLRCPILVLACAQTLPPTFGAVFGDPGVGTDQWFHAWFASALLTGHGFPAGAGQYAHFPLAEAAAAGLSSLTGLGPTTAVQLVNMLPLLLAPLAIYALARRLTGEKAALLAALLVATSTWQIYWVQEGVPFSLGLAGWVLFVVANGLAVTPRRLGPAGVTIAALGVLMFLHPISSVAVLLVLGVTALVSLVSRLTRAGPSRQGPTAGASMLLLAIVAYIAYLNYVAPDLAATRLQQLSYDIRSTGVLGAASHYTGLYFELNNVGFYLLLSLAVGGSVVWLARRRNDGVIVLVIIALGCAAIGYAGEALGLLSFLPFRWLALATFALCVVVGRAIAGAVGRLHPAPWRLLAAGSLVGLYAGFSLIPGVVTPDSPLFQRSATVRERLSAGELAGVQAALAQPQRRIFADFILDAPLSTLPGSSRHTIYTLGNEQLRHPPVGALVLVRQYDIMGPVQRPVYRLSSKDIASLKSQSMDRLLDSGAVQGYAMPLVGIRGRSP